MLSSPLSRRRLLSTTALVVFCAGCSGTPSEPTTSAEPAADGSSVSASSSSDTPTATSERTGTDAPTTPTPSPATDSSAEPETEGMTDTSEGLDLREANVVGVEFERSGDSYRFSVTLYHDDDGEAGYADWWQVETLSGERLGRRTLLHAHSTAPFTRSETISVPEGVGHVVVRGHDQTHGYGGQAMVVNVETGASEPVRQGPEPREFSTYDPGV